MRSHTQSGKRGYRVTNGPKGLGATGRLALRFVAVALVENMRAISTTSVNATPNRAPRVHTTRPPTLPICGKSMVRGSPTDSVSAISACIPPADRLCVVVSKLCSACVIRTAMFNVLRRVAPHGRRLAFTRGDDAAICFDPQRKSTGAPALVRRPIFVG